MPLATRLTLMSYQPLDQGVNHTHSRGTAQAPQSCTSSLHATS